MHFTLIRWTWSFPQWNTSLVLAHCLCSVHSEWPEPISLSTHHLNCTLLTTFNGNIGTSYFFSKHILWLFFFSIQGHHDASLWKNPRTFSSLQQKSYRHFHPADFKIDSPCCSCPQYPTEMCTKIQSNEHTYEK